MQNRLCSRGKVEKPRFDDGEAGKVDLHPPALNKLCAEDPIRVGRAFEVDISFYDKL